MLSTRTGRECRPGGRAVDGYGWDVFRHAHDQPDVHVALHSLPTAGGAILEPLHRDGALIVVDPRFDGPERRERLAHELVHLERGGGIDDPDMPDSWRTVVLREERWVNDEVARRMVPPAVLCRYVEGVTACDGEVSIDDVARDFNVPRRVAGRALQLLARTDPRAQR